MGKLNTNYGGKVFIMNKKKVFSFLLAFLLLIITVSVSVKDVDAAGDFEMDMYTLRSVNSGILDVHVKITNHSSDFSGTLRVAVTNSNYNRVGYDVDISIPKGAEKEYIVSVPVNGVMVSENVQGIILDKSNKVKYDNSFRGVLSTYYGTISAGVLSDHADDLSFLDLGGNKVGNDTADKKSVKLTTVSSNTLKDELNNLQMLIIDDYDTSTLDAATMSGIENWIRNGGMLLLGTGSAAERVLSGFDNNFLEIDYNDETTVGFPYEGNGDSTFDLTYAIVNPGSSYEYKEEGLVVCPMMSGSIGVVPYKLADFKDHTKEANAIIPFYYNGLLSFRSDSDLNSSNSLNIYNIKNLLSYMEKPANTSVPVLIIILLIYVVLVGPIIYLILKAMKKQETIWYMIPCIAVLFMGFVFILSFSVKVRGLILRSVSIVDLDSHSENAYILGYNPKPSEWSIKTKYAYNTASVISSGGYISETDISGTVKLGGDNELTFIPSESFDIGTFVYPATNSNAGGFDIDAQLDPNTFYTDDPDVIGHITDSDSASSLAEHIAGSLTNNSGMNFDYVLVCLGSKYQLIENMKSGEAKDIKLDSQLTYTYSSDIAEDIAQKAYKAKEYDKAAKLGALALAYETIGNSYNNNITDLIVIGVREQDGLTDKNEQSWMCCYSTCSELY